MSKSSIQNLGSTTRQVKFFEINGSKYAFEHIFSIFDLLDYLGFNKNVIVIDYNGVLLEKKFWKETYVKNNDFLEILSVAGGG